MNSRERCPGSVAGVQRVVEIDAGQDREDIGLQERDEEFERGERDGCKVAGCSSQLCLPAGLDEGTSTCEWRDEYACYRDGGARCEMQSDGACGWTPTGELAACLADPPAMSRPD